MKLAFDIKLQKGDFGLHAKADLPAESVTAIIGKSGAGKSSLLRCLAGLEPSAEGVILAGEESWLKDGRSLAPHFRRIGFVFQHAALFEHLSVSGNLHYAQRRVLGDDRFTLDEIVRATRIDRLLNRMPDSLSGGERQRVAIARAVAANPQALFLDEPLSAVDEEARGALLNELERLFGVFGIPALYVTHNLAEAARISNYAIKMEAGSIVEHGPTEEVLTPKADSDTPFSIVSIESRRDLADENLSCLETNIGQLLLPTIGDSTQIPARILIRAQDVGISLSRLNESSILNQIPATVHELKTYPTGQTLVTMQCQGVKLYSLITRRSAQTLNLQPGTSLLALIKGVALGSS